MKSVFHQDSIKLNVSVEEHLVDTEGEYEFISSQVYAYIHSKYGNLIDELNSWCLENTHYPDALKLYSESPIFCQIKIINLNLIGSYKSVLTRQKVHTLNFDFTLDIPIYSYEEEVSFKLLFGHIPEHLPKNIEPYLIQS